MPGLSFEIKINVKSKMIQIWDFKLFPSLKTENTLLCGKVSLWLWKNEIFYLNTYVFSFSKKMSIALT